MNITNLCDSHNVNIPTYTFLYVRSALSSYRITILDELPTYYFIVDNFNPINSYYSPFIMYSRCCILVT